MKFINLFIILLLTFGCSSDKDTAEFEKVLGKENSQTLTLLVNGFENDFLKKQYPNSELNESYKKFLIVSSNCINTNKSRSQTYYSLKTFIKE